MKKSLNKIFLLLGLATGSSFLCFLFYFLGNSRSELLKDYVGKTPSFYRYEFFINEQFTEVQKYQGNIIAIIAIAALVVFAILIFPLLKVNIKDVARQSAALIRSSLFWIIGLCVICILLNVYSFKLNPLSTDEAFSAQNFARMPMVHLLTYYPLPNNHIFFNLLNHFAAKILGDYILSGRIISGFCYCLLICGNFLFFSRFLRNQFLSFLCCILLAQQLMIWGFGAQSRGYALYYLLQWGSFVGFYNYYFKEESNKKLNLLLLLFCNILGAWTIPSFLYFLSFQIGAALLLQVYKRQWNLQFWKAILLSILGAFLVYVPVFCYSGVKSVLLNKYVAGADISRFQVVSDLIHQFKQNISMATFGFATIHPLLALSFFILPFGFYFLFRRKQRHNAPMIFLGLMIWGAVFTMVVYSRQLPVLRAIGFQMHLSLLIFLLVFLSLIIGTLKNKILLNTGFTLLIVFASYATFTHNSTVMATELYGQNTVAFMNGLQQSPVLIKDKERVWLSDESYMWNFLLPKGTQIVNYDCAFARQEILIISEDDKAIPGLNMNDYILIQKISWFDIYRLK